MQYKSIVLTLLLVMGISGIVSAKKWRVNNTLLAPTQVDFNELTDAVNNPSVASGDTIYVEGSALEYEGGVEIYKQLTIIGPGYLLQQDNIQPSSCNHLPATIGSGGILLSVGSDGTYITGLTIYLNPNSTSVEIEKTSNITITRNRLENIDFPWGASQDINLCHNIIFTRNLICGEIYFSGNFTINTLLVSNNLIENGIRVNPNANLAAINNGTIKNNTFRNGATIWVNGCEIAYNFVGNIDSDTENISIHHNVLNLNNNDNNIIVANDPTNVIDPYDDDAFGCNTDNWTMLPADQIPYPDHGAYVGCFPYYDMDDPVSIANVPAFPVIFECNISSCGDQTITIQLGVKTND